MPRLAVRRRTLVWLALAYFASLGGLAWLIPHRPRLSFSAGEYPHLIGFSPDGSRLATAAESPWRAGLDNRPNAISVWDVGGGPFAAATRLSERPAGWLNYLAWSWVDDPGRRWLFWQCVDAGDVPARLGELLSVSDIEAGDLDPTEDTPRIRVSENGTYVAVRNSDGAYQVSERSTGRVCATTGPTDIPPAFGPKRDEMTTVEKAPSVRRVTVHRWNLKTGHESPPVQFDVFAGAGVRPTMDGRWLLAHSGQVNAGSGFHRGDLHDSRTGRRAVSVDSSQQWRLVRPGDYLLTVRFHSGDSPIVEFHDLRHGVSRTTILPGASFPQPSAVSPDGDFVVVADDRNPDLPQWNWPASLKLAYSLLTTVRGTDTASLYVCKSATGEVVARLPAAALNSTALTGEGTAAFSDDGRQLAVVGAGGEVRVYDWPLGRPWLFISALAAVLPLFSGSVVFGHRRIRRRE